jgi:thiamine-monophosphate kinase
MVETLEDIGEFGLISRIAEIVYTSSDLALDFSDDAALWHQGSGWLIATTDAVVEDIDFRLNTFSWEDIGWKALAVNLSDIAAMGGTPRGAFVTLCLPAGCETAAVSAFYRGMSLLAEEAETPILGGDLSSSAQVMVNVTVIGEVESPERVLKRNAAQVGDQVAVTGVLGSAAAGLALLERGDSGDTPHAARFVAAQRRPTPRLREGRALVDIGVRCGMDVSDGLAADLKKLCLASGVAAEVMLSSIPTDSNLQMVFGESFREHAIGGGEDFELLFTAPPEVMSRAEACLSSNSPAHCTVIGTIVPGHSGAISMRDEHGRAMPGFHEGFDHFGTAAAPLSGG